MEVHGDQDRGTIVTIGVMRDVLKIEGVVLVSRIGWIRILWKWGNK